MLREPRNWRPGSFTKNFSWGPTSHGLRRLHDAIRLVFLNGLEDVPREVAQDRLIRAGYVWHIPLNFFLLNCIRDGQSFIAVDELVYQAVEFEYSPDFDKIALIAFNNSYVGEWVGAESWQNYPAPWAYNYVNRFISDGKEWKISQISADHIQKFIESNPKYVAKSARKISTNLNYMYRAGRISEMDSPAIERWWVNALFLTLDRSLAERGEFEVEVPQTRLSQYVAQSGFLDVSGPRSRNKELAIQPLVSLYSACGGLRRWSRQFVQERQALKLPDINWFANSDDPFFAIYPEDPNIIKAVPRACAMLAKNLAGFDELDAEELINWNVLEYVRRKTRSALAALKERGIKPTMTADQLLKITRGEDDSY